MMDIVNPQGNHDSRHFPQERNCPFHMPLGHWTYRYICRNNFKFMHIYLKQQQDISKIHKQVKTTVTRKTDTLIMTLLLR